MWQYRTPPMMMVGLLTSKTILMYSISIKCTYILWPSHSTPGFISHKKINTGRYGNTFKDISLRYL